ncbi:MAG: LysE family translocator [Pseudomonadota bacterium]
MSLEVYLLYLATLAVYFTAPPDTTELLVVSNSLRLGYKRTLSTIAGDLTANTIQMTAAAFGLGAIIYTSAYALIWIKWFGVAYLLWMGLRLVFKKTGTITISSKSSESGMELFRQGFVTSTVNPYAIIFFAALFPQFINPEAAILPQLLILGVTVLFFDFLSLSFYGLAATQAATRLKQINMNVINRISGSFMIAAACLLATKDLEVEPVK